MKWEQESSPSVNQAFSDLRESNRVFSNIIAIQFEQVPEKFPVVVTGTSTCPGCNEEYNFEIKAYRDFGASDKLTCSNPSCKDVYFVHAVYRPGRATEPEKAPIYLYADLYTTLKGQQLAHIVLDEINVR